MRKDDIQPPEFIAYQRSGRKIQQVPFVYQRADETWEQFCERERRVSHDLNNPPELEKRKPPIGGILIAVVIGIMLWVAIWELLK